MGKMEFWIGPPEHAKPEDRIHLWLEDGDLELPKLHGKAGVRGSESDPYIIVGFDTEFKTPGYAVTANEVRAGEAVSEILSYQFYAKCSDGRTWRGICCPDANQRLSLPQFMLFVLGLGARLANHKALPTRIYLVGHFTRADIPAFSDFQKISGLISAVRNTFISIDGHIGVDVPVDDEEVGLKIFLRDTMLLTPQSSRSLKKIGDLVGIQKVELSPDRETYRTMIRNMDSVRRDQWELFKEYALTDAVICVEYLDRVLAEYKAVTGKAKVPVTLTGIGIDLLEKQWAESGYDRLRILGKELVKTKEYNKRQGYFFKKTLEKDIHPVHYGNALATDCYHGGRNEQYWFGPAFSDDWSDFDLSSAYPTAMSLIGMPDWEAMRATSRLEDFTPTALGYAVIEFEFPQGTRFPTLPVRTGNGLVFPLRGRTECPAPEIYLARKLGARIKILQGLLVPTDGSKPVFENFIRECIEKRRSVGKNTLRGLFWKEISNSTYGKTAQGLRERRVYDLRERETKLLPPSRITNAYFAAFITSFVRAVLGEIMNSIPENRMVFSCTTDGFLSNITDDEAAKCSSGVLCELYREQRKKLTGDDSVLEKKHYIKTPLGWRTRGQATLEAGVPHDPDGKHVLLAKGGIWTPPEYEELEDQNDEILNYFFDRTPDTEIEIEGKTGLRDMVELGADFVEKLIVKRLNMEYDWKRRPVGVVQSKLYDHVAFSTEPWVSVEQFVLMRDTFDEYQRGSPRCIKTIEDLVDLSKYVETKTIASSNELKYVRKVDGDMKRLRQMLCSAFKHGKAGMARYSSTNLQFAELLTAHGMKCSKADVENGLKKEFVPNQVPPTDRVVAFLHALKRDSIPALQIEKFLVELEKSGMMIRLINDVSCPFTAKVR
jgi:hypothetical protein